MRAWKNCWIAMLLVLLPAVASAQYHDLDNALSALSRGFHRGETQPVIQGIASDEQVDLQFPGLITESGFFGRDQASYLLDGLFNKVHPSDFQQMSARKVSAEGQYHITARWTIQIGGKSEQRDLYITLKSKGDQWTLVSIRSAGQ